jgi:hypothetical protein
MALLSPEKMKRLNCRQKRKKNNRSTIALCNLLHSNR